MLASTPVGGEFVVGAFDASIEQSFPDVGSDAAGNYVVSWAQHPENVSIQWRGYAQRFAASGTALGPAIQVTELEPNVFDTRVAVAPDGSIVVAWADAAQKKLWARQYDSGGAARGGAIKVAEFMYATASCDVAMTSDGRFAVSYYDDGETYNSRGTVYVNTYGADGTLQQIRQIASSSRDRSLAMHDSGSIVIGYDYDANTGGNAVGKAQLLTAAASQIALPLDDSGAYSVNSNPRVAMDAVGNSIVVWQASHAQARFLLAQRFDALGNRLGGQLIVGQFPTSEQVFHCVATDNLSGIAVAWSAGLGRTAHLQRFTANGIPDGGQIKLTNAFAGSGSPPALAYDAEGNSLLVFARHDLGSAIWLGAQRYARVDDPSSVSGVVWEDSGFDGIRDANEPARSGVEVQLYNAAGAMADSARSAPDGSYRFDTLRPGDSYYLKIVPSATGHDFLSPGNAGSDDTLDSDADATTGRTVEFTAPAAGQTSTGWDFGIAPAGSLSGVVFNDLDGDGLRSSGEPELTKWTVFNDMNLNGALDAGEYSMQLSGSSYTFSNVRPGPHRLCVTPQADWVISSSAEQRTYLVLPGQTRANSDIGVRLAIQSASSLRWGGEVAVNSTTAGNQSNPSVARDYAGNFIVAWQAPGPDGLDIFAQRFDAAGARVGPEFRANTHTAGDQINPAVGMDADGDFVIVWQSAAQDGSGAGIYAQRYRSIGVPRGPELRINTYTTDDQRDPAVAMNAAGDFVVAWVSATQADGKAAIFAKRYKSATNAFYPEFLVNSSSGNLNSVPAVSVNSNGVAAFAWSTDNPAVFARVFDGNDTALTGFRTASSSGDSPSVAIDASNAFVVTWQKSGVYAQWFNSTFSTVGSAVQVSTSANVDEGSPSVACDAAGNALVAWHGANAATASHDIFGQYFAPGGVRLGYVFRVNSYGPDSQFLPATAVGPDGNAVVAWESYLQDTDQLGVFAQRYERIAQPATIGGIAWDDLNGNGIREEVEPPRASVPVRLRALDGFLYETQVTQIDGSYRFNVVRPDEPVIVEFHRPSELLFTYANTGGDDARDSDVEAGGRLSVFSLGAGETKLTCDVGFMPPVPVSGVWFNDLNGDGLKDAGEEGLSGRLMFLDADADGLYDADEPVGSTDAMGAFTMAGVAPGQYVLRQVSQDGWTATTPAVPVQALFGQPVTGVLAGGRSTGVDSPPMYPVGSELKIGAEAIASSPDGYWVKVASGSGRVVAELFDDRGASRGAMFDVGYINDWVGAAPRVAMAPDHSFAVTWTDTSGTYRYVYARRFDSNGVALGNAFRVNTSNGPHVRSNAALAIDSSGNFVIVWQSAGKSDPTSAIVARRYNSAGAALGGEFIINSASIRGANPSIAVKASGEFVVAWDGQLDATDHRQVLARRYSADGTPASDEFLVAVDRLHDKQRPVVCMSGLGQFAVAFSASGQDGSGRGVDARVFDATGTAQGGDIAVNLTTAGEQDYPWIVMDDAGTFTVSWVDTPGAPGQSVKLRRFNSAGVPQTAELSVFDAPLQQLSRRAPIAIDGDGDLLVAWSAYTRRYSTRPLITSVSGRAWGDTDRDGIRDASESAIDGQTVQLLDQAGKLIVSTITSNGGHYSFGNFAPGQASYIAVSLSASQITLRDVGADDTVDSDFVPATGRAGPFTLATGQFLDSIDLGILLAASSPLSAPGQPEAPPDQPIGPAEAGPVLVKDIFPGISGASIAQMVEYKGAVYFVASTANQIQGIWRSDGTAEGTWAIKEFAVAGTDDGIRMVTVAGDQIYFSVNRRIWRSDGTPAGTIELADRTFTASPGPFTACGGWVYFAARTATGGEELWRSDGTPERTGLFKEIMSGSSSSYPREFYEYDGTLYFQAQDSTGNELWRSDGTNSGTYRLKDLMPGTNQSGAPRSFFSVNQSLCFLASDGLWRTDGTPGGTVRISNVAVNYVGILNDQVALLSAGYSGESNTELWRTDGTAAGTYQLLDINAGGSSLPRQFVRFNGQVYFLAQTGSNLDLWKTDGTVEGTVLVAGLGSGSSQVYNLTATASGLYFFFRPEVGLPSKLWTSDGTAAGTRELCIGDRFAGFAMLGPQLLFVFEDPVVGRELHKWEEGAGLPSEAVISPAEVAEGGVATLAGWVSPMQAGVTYLWDLDGDGLFGETGAAALRGEESGRTPVFNAAGLDGPSTWRVWLRASDGADFEGTISALVSVRNVEPILSIPSTARATEGTAFVLDVGVSDPATDAISSWRIDWGDGVIDMLDGDLRRFTHVFRDGPGSSFVHVRATDEDSQRTGVVFVTIDGAAPTLRVVPPPVVTEGMLAAFNLSVMELGTDTITSWFIDWGDGIVETIPGNPATLQHRYIDNGFYPISGTATDEDGTFTVVGLTLPVGNVAPQVTVAPPTITGLRLTQTGSFADPGDDLWSATVDYGDGSGPLALVLAPDKSFALDHTYARDGLYQVIVAVRDIDGAAGTSGTLHQVGALAGAADDTFTLRLDPSGALLQVFLNGGPTPIFSGDLATAPRLTLDGLAGDDTFIIDSLHGNPLPAAGLLIRGGEGTDAMLLSGSASPETWDLGESQVRYNGHILDYLSIESVSIEGGEGNDLLAINAPLAMSPVFSAGMGGDAIHISAGYYGASIGYETANVMLRASNNAWIAIGDSGELASLHLEDLSRGVLSGVDGVLRLGSLHIGNGARLDLGRSRLIIQALNDATATHALSEALAALAIGGLQSSYVDADARRITAIAVVRNAPASVRTPLVSFGGLAVNANSILLQAALLGDADLDGAITADDYYCIDRSFAACGSGWGGGDFNQDSRVDIDDYFLIDRSYALQVVPYSRMGDADADGVIDADDYFRIDAGWLAHGSGYRNGDFNYDGRIDIDDYFLIDRAYALQAGPLAAQSAPQPLGATPGDGAFLQGAPSQAISGLFGTAVEAEDDLAAVFGTTPVGIF